MVRDDLRTHQEFEQEWAKQHRIYSTMLSVKTLRVVKQMAKCVYLQGRIDGMVYTTEKNLQRQLGGK